MTMAISRPDFLLQTIAGEWIPINNTEDLLNQSEGILFSLVPCSIDDKPIYAGPKNSETRFIKWNGAFGCDL